MSASPEIVILDEPTSAIDVSVQAQVLDLLDRVRRERDLTYVFISHNLSVVRQISDRVAVMYAGRVVEIGRSDDVFSHARHWYTRALIAAVPSTDPRRRDIVEERAATAPAAAVSQGCAFAPRCPAAQARCWTEKPELVEVRPRQLTACHFPVSATP